ncbi:hypothetical protein GCM10011343_03960 [Flavobacterium orientale]|uniref:TonB-dependent receptor n=1 Tax=Flavobacterium orientale TaxID=1756020 RepID=A0A916XW00_9FLAO|nr:hypothetical protein GCM10011343_03960 [Flavobacterium orientale]
MASFSSKAQISKDTTALSEVILLASPIKNSVQKTAHSVSVLTQKDINQNDGVILTPILNSIPGIYMQQGALNTNRITIRGIGARSQFSTNRIKAYFEEIPLTSAEGESVIEDIELETMQRIEISKGPNSTSFGAGLGGVISLFGKQTPAVSFAKITSTIGSFGMQKQTISGGINDSKLNLYTNYTHLKSDGFRENSNYDRQSLNLFGTYQISQKGTMNFIGIATKLKAYIPSSINETDFENNPEVAASNWKAAQGFESYDKLLLGLGYQHDFSKKWTWNTSVFSTLKDAFEPRPFDILKDKNTNFGIRSKLNFTTQLLQFPTKFSLGSEFMIENYSFSLFENLYQSQPGQGSILGEKFSGISQKRNYADVFFQMEMQLSEKLQLESGIAFNSTNYSQKDSFNQQEMEREIYNFPTTWSPRIGTSYQLKKGQNIYASISKGFSLASVAETLTPEGEINTSLLPEIGINYEIGFKGNFLQNKLYTEIAIYTTSIKNLLVAQRIAEDQYVGINAGKSKHQGIEYLIKYRLLSSDKAQINTSFSGTINHFKFIDFIDNDNDFSNNYLPGVANFQWNVGLDFTTATGFSFTSSFRSVGGIYLNDENSIATERYKILDCKTNYSFEVVKNLKMETFFGVQNSLNEKYAASILPNAVGFGNALPRYFYPGNPRNYYGGINLTYQFQ